MSQMMKALSMDDLDVLAKEVADIRFSSSHAELALIYMSSVRDNTKIFTVIEIVEQAPCSRKQAISLFKQLEELDFGKLRNAGRSAAGTKKLRRFELNEDALKVLKRCVSFSDESCEEVLWDEEPAQETVLQWNFTFKHDCKVTVSSPRPLTEYQVKAMTKKVEAHLLRHAESDSVANFKPVGKKRASKPARSSTKPVTRAAAKKRPASKRLTKNSAQPATKGVRKRVASS